MPIQEKRVRVTLDQNPNLKVTAQTREHIGVNACDTDEVQARLLGIPGPAGPAGINWRGQWTIGATYTYGDAVSYFGSSYFYISQTDEAGKNPIDNPTYWEYLSLKGADGTSGSGTDQSAQIMAEPTGFPNKADSRIYLDDATRTMHIEPTGVQFSYWISGTEYFKTSPESVQIPDIESVYFFYYDVDNYLKVSSVFPIPLEGKVTVCLAYWDARQQKFTYFGEERHGLVMDWATHGYLHETVGCQFAHGLDLFYTENGTGSSDLELEVGLSDGVVYDEDLRHSITNSGAPSNFFEQILYPIAELPIVYKSDSGGYWNVYDATNIPFHFNGTAPVYNEFTGTEWLVSPVPNSNYFVMWIFATNEVNHPIISYMGQSVDTNLEKSLQKNTFENLVLDDIPTPELKLLYRVVYQHKSNLTNTYKTQLIQVDDYRIQRDKAEVGSGIAPSAGDKHQTFIQSVAASVWIINHGMNKVPSVWVKDSGESMVEGDVEVIDLNNIRITFSAPFTGTAYLN